MRSIFRPPGGPAGAGRGRAGLAVAGQGSAGLEGRLRAGRPPLRPCPRPSPRRAAPALRRAVQPSLRPLAARHRPRPPPIGRASAEWAVIGRRRGPGRFKVGWRARGPCAAVSCALPGAARSPPPDGHLPARTPAGTRTTPRPRAASLPLPRVQMLHRSASVPPPGPQMCRRTVSLSPACPKMCPAPV